MNLQRLGVSSIIIILLLSLLFNVYITNKYFIRDWKTWTGFSRFSDSIAGSVYMCLHWVGGFIINILGSFQLLSKTVKMNERISKYHKYSGRIYLFSVLITCIGGLLFVFHIKTAGGWQMDTSFSVYGVLMIICATKTWKYAGKNVKLHYEWATRLYSLGIGSMIYRIIVIPVYALDKDSFPSFEDYEIWASKYLITASWFFYVPNLIVAEFLILYWRRTQVKQDGIPAPISQEEPVTI